MEPTIPISPGWTRATSDWQAAGRSHNPEVQQRRMRERPSPHSYSSTRSPRAPSHDLRFDAFFDLLRLSRTKKASWNSWHPARKEKSRVMNTLNAFCLGAQPAPALCKRNSGCNSDFPLPRIFAENLLDKHELSVTIAATQTRLHFFSSCSPHRHFTSTTRNQRNLDHFPCPRAKFTMNTSKK